MVREKNPDIHTIKEHIKQDIDFQIQIHEGEVGFTSGVTRDKKPKEIDTKSVDCYAKVVYIPIEDGGPLEKYFVKIGLSGFIFDPWGIFSEGTQAKDAKHFGRLAWEFKRVSKQCFENYIMYLTTRNKAYLNLAERESRSNA